MNSPAFPTQPREIPGRRIVVGLFAFGIVATGSLWFYWKLHVAPFLPLQQALAEEFEDSRPRVEGGQRKIHRGTPNLLRITMKVGFDPTKGGKRVEEFVRRVVEFTRNNYDLRRYQQLELHLYWPEPEKELRQQTFSINVSTPMRETARNQ